VLCVEEEEEEEEEEEVCIVGGRVEIRIRWW
jgi:hypothetical protein